MFFYAIFLLLQSLTFSFAWIPINSPWTTLQSISMKEMERMRPPPPPPPPPVLVFSEVFSPVDFRKPKTQSFYKATLSPFEQPVYEYRYKVHDPKEENYQEKSETRVGDSVRGYYSVKEPSGYISLVRYVSDKNGFQTEVSHRHADIHGGNFITQFQQLT